MKFPPGTAIPHATQGSPTSEVIIPVLPIITNVENRTHGFMVLCSFPVSADVPSAFGRQPFPTRIPAEPDVCASVLSARGEPREWHAVAVVAIPPK